MARQHRLGKAGEELAAAFLEEQGFEILERNWRHGKAEVDLIAVNENRLVVVEVKTRSTAFFGEPEEAVTESKQRLLSDAAQAYVDQRKIVLEVRFDVIAIVSTNGQNRLHHIPAAFYPGVV